MLQNKNLILTYLFEKFEKIAMAHIRKI